MTAEGWLFLTWGFIGGFIFCILLLVAIYGMVKKDDK